MPDVLKKGGLGVAIVLIYFFGIREIRQEIHDFYMGTILPDEYGQINDHYAFYSQSSVSFTILSQAYPNSKGWQFKVPFGSFWLFGTFALALISAKKKEYFVLSGIHVLAGVITLLFVMIGLNGINFFLGATDFISRYLLPLFSLGYVALLIGQNNSKFATDE